MCYQPFRYQRDVRRHVRSMERRRIGPRRPALALRKANMPKNELARKVDFTEATGAIARRSPSITSQPWRNRQTPRVTGPIGQRSGFDAVKKPLYYQV